MIVNGNEVKYQEEISVRKLLEIKRYDAKTVAVEKNGVIVPKRNFETEMLSDGDKIEIVCFVGGG